MILAIVIQLTALRDCRYTHFTGRGTHGFWLKSWRAIDPHTGDWLHAAHWDLPLDAGASPAPVPPSPAPPESIAPYAVSPLMGLPAFANGAQRIPRGWAAWLRVSVFHPALALRMVEGPRPWLSCLPERITIDGAEWQVTGVTTDPARHPWAGQSSFEALRHAALDAADPPARWRVEFATPTAIRGARIDGRDAYLLFPLPDRLLESWRRAWNVYARCEDGHDPLEIDAALAERARETLRVTHYRLETSTVAACYGSNHSSKPVVPVPVTGYTGAAVFESLDAAPVRALEDLLFRFAFYRGAGYHTTQGLGMLRAVDDDEGGG